MKKILQINVTSNWGSTGKIAEQIGIKAMERGWRSYLAYGRYANKSVSYTINMANRAEQAIHLVASRLFDCHGLFSHGATRNLIREIQTIQPDIIHLQNIHGYYLNYPMLFRFLTAYGKPVVWTLHDCWAFTGHCSHFDEVNCDRWKNSCGNCPGLKVYPKSLLDRSRRNLQLKKEVFSLPKNITLVPVSQWIASFLTDSILSNRRVVPIQNGINLDTFRPIGLSEKYNHLGEYVLGVANQWESRKGLGDFIRLRERLEGLNIVLVGLTKDQIVSLPKGIIGIERTQSAEELAMLYSGAVALVNPTYADTLPTVNIESLACGTPVITYRTGGSPEILDAHTGIVVDKGDVDSILSAIKVIRANGKDYYSSACRKRAEERFDMNVQFNKYIDLYEELIRQDNMKQKSGNTLDISKKGVMGGGKSCLRKFDNSWYSPGRGVAMRLAWYITNEICFKSGLLIPYGFKAKILKAFGAHVGERLCIKPCVNIKYPWNLEIGDDCWIGENVWIDNLGKVKIGSNVCVSQGAMLLCGNHNYRKEAFDLMVGDISLEDGCWVGAQTTVCPNVTLKSHSVLTVGSIATKDLEAYGIYQGVPAVKIKTRNIE